MSTTLVSLIDVYKYDVKHPFNLDINKGDVIIISGHNGSGKTTLINLILGFITPANGKMYRKDMKISYLPEQNQLPFFMYGYIFLRLQEKMKKTEIKPELLHLFNVPLFRYVQHLSKGNQQKLGIIATLMGSSDLIILDEPFSGLDDSSAMKLVDYLQGLKEVGQTMMISTHQPERFNLLKTKVISL